MTKLAIDFGTSNIVLAVWNAAKNEPETLLLKPFSLMAKQDEESIAVIPSLIHYTTKGDILIGDQVLKAQLEQDNQTFASIKSEILKDFKHRHQINSKHVPPKQIATDLLATILKAAILQLNLPANEPIAVTTPVEAFEHYSDWLANTFRDYNFNIRTFDEPTAAAVSLGQKIQENDVWILFDFGAGTLDLSVVKFKEDFQSPTGMKHYVLAKESVDVAGDLIDQWIAQHFLEKLSLSPDDQIFKSNQRQLLQNCRTAKEALTYKTEATILLQDLINNKTLNLIITRDDFHSILTHNGLFKTINDLIADCKQKMRNKGFDPDAIKGIFMVGGSSFIPAIKTKLEENFYKPGQVILHRPLNAIARGAAALAAGAKLKDHIQHSYYLHYLDPDNEQTTDQLIIKAGTNYPSSEPITKLTFYAKTFNQNTFKMFFYEESHRKETESNRTFKLKDEHTPEPYNTAVYQSKHVQRMCVNPDVPIVLRTGSTFQKGEAALDIEFSIDENKHLTLSTYKYNEHAKPVPVNKLIKAIKLK